MVGQWPKVLGAAPLGTLPISLSVKWSIGPSSTVKTGNPGISMKMPSFPKGSRNHLTVLVPAFIHGSPVPWLIS